MRVIRLLAVPLVALLGLAACRQAPPPAETPGDRLESPELGLAIAALPAPFEEAGSGPSTWTFSVPGEGGDGELLLTVGPRLDGGINLVEEVKERRAWFEETEGAEYFGNRELAGPIGTIFTARGTYPGPDGDVVEETTAFAIHPDENRLLKVAYTYPTGESGTRVEQLMIFLGEIEGLGGGDADAP